MESAIGIYFKGYPYFLEKFRKEEKDVHKTRLMLQKAIVLKGEDAARIFYDKQRFKRKGATPKRFQKTLFGEGGVQGLDKGEHIHRKKMFMEIMSRESISDLEENFRKYWKKAMKYWETTPETTLFPESEKILLRASCDWIGIAVDEDDVEKRTAWFSNMIDGSGAIGIRHWKGRTGRKRAEKWIKKIVNKIRKHPEEEVPDSILKKFCFHRDRSGRLLKPEVVAVELINLIRPIVAIARYIVFAAHALETYPQYKDRLKNDSNDLDLYFVQEVRRYYPFFPFISARVAESFTWRQVKFPQGRRVLLDLYATCHDNKTWANPDTFYAERFIDWQGNAFNFIPQGGGDHDYNHRCAGEWITINLTRISLDFLMHEMTYSLPKQNLDIDMSRIPAIPESRFKMENVKRNFRVKSAR